MSAIKTISRYATPITSVLRTGLSEGTDEEHLATMVEYDQTGHLAREVRFFDNGQIEEEHRYQYDKNGHLIRHQILVPGEGIEERFDTERNEAGMPVVITKYYGDEAGERTLYEYSQDLKPVKIEYFDADNEPESTEELRYDSQSRLDKRRILHHQDETDTHFHFRYNDAGQLILQEEHDEKNNLLSKTEFQYDEFGREILSRQINEKGELTHEVKQEYDEEGRVVKRVSRSFYIRITTLIYDERGNLIEESVRDENDFAITRSRYEYDENNRMTAETTYETDLSRSGRDTHMEIRYAYTFHE